MPGVIKKFYIKYEFIRNKHLGEKWNNLSSFWKRLFSDAEYHADLISKEIEINKEFKIFAISILKDHGDNKIESVDLVISAIKNHKEKLMSRTSYLLILTTSIGLLGAIIGVASSFGYDSKLFSSLAMLVSIIVLNVLIIERHKINIYSATSQELINILDSIRSEELSPIDSEMSVSHEVETNTN